MVEFTFVVGGGKLANAMYDEELPKWATAGLRAIGYSEDRSLAETFDSPGAGGGDTPPALNLKSPEYIMCLDAFKTKVNQKISSWRQCKRLLKILQENNKQVKAIMAKQCTGAPLLPLEQVVYDGNSGVNEEKMAWLQGEERKYVDDGRITASEKVELQAGLEAILASVTKDLAAGKPKEAEELEKMRTKVLLHKAAAEKVGPIQLRLRLGDEVLRLRMMLLPLIELGKKAKSQTLTMDDLTVLRDKPGIEEDIVKLENASRGWFEDEEDFQARCHLETSKAKIKFEKSSTKGGKGGADGKAGGSTGMKEMPSLAPSKKPAGSSAAVTTIEVFVVD